jgi:tyrosyl-tRNA synthetase
MIHGKEELENAIKASNILFGNSSAEDLKSLNEQTFLAVFEGVPQAEIALNEIEAGYSIVDAFVKNEFLASGNETRRALKENAVAVNKAKVKEDYLITCTDLINGKYVLLQKGKKNYYLLKAV